MLISYFRSVIFPGFVQKAHNRSWSSWFSAHSKVSVRVAINTSGVWVIDSDKKVRCLHIVIAF